MLLLRVSYNYKNAHVYIFYIHTWDLNKIMQ